MSSWLPDRLIEIEPVEVPVGVGYAENQEGSGGPQVNLGIGAAASAGCSTGTAGNQPSLGVTLCGGICVGVNTDTGPFLGGGLGVSLDIDPASFFR